MLFFLALCALLVAVLIWGAWRLLRWLPWRLTAWVALVVAGVTAVLSPGWPITPTTKVLVVVWSYSIILLPVWWAGRGLWRRWRGVR